MRWCCTLILASRYVFATLLNQLHFGPKCVLAVVEEVLVIVTALLHRLLELKVKEAGHVQARKAFFSFDILVWTISESMAIMTLQLGCFLIRLRCLLAF